MASRIPELASPGPWVWGIFSWQLGSIALECFKLCRLPLGSAPVYMGKRAVVDFALSSHGFASNCCISRAGKAIWIYANRRYSTVKLPFPLTPQFKSMLQSGVGTRDLDVRWVSSLSWYFLTLFGLQPVYNFILGSNNGTCSVDIRLTTSSS